ncbi:MAG: serine/threonine-protein kinase [Nannocystaceae bacterium]|nr:serine/threonine-protein kinase [Nannocystaceae bacterium]
MSEPTDPTDATFVDGEPAATLVDGEPSADPSSPRVIERGHSIGRYLVVDTLGAGAMGVVYRAYDPDLDRTLALKVVSQQADGSTRGAKEQGRLLREAQAMARVSHRNVIQVFDVGTIDSAVYVAMEFVDGVTLKKWLVPKRTPAQVLRLFEAAGRGLAAAHGQGLIHRDFKPDNVMVDTGDLPRVLDFGLARTSHRTDADESTQSFRNAEASISLDSSMTEAGTVMGTPAYMSPEQYRGEPADQRSDQFSFCVALFEALVGRRPFEGRTVTALAAAVTRGEVVLPSPFPVPRGVMQAILRGLSVEPSDRHPSMEALLAKLVRTRAGSRGLGVLVGGAGLAIGAVALARGNGAVHLPPPCQGAADDAAAVWSPQRQDVIEATFTARAGERGLRVWSDAARRIDGYLARWVSARTDACEATRLRSEQSEALLDVRMACYDARLRGVDATLHALESVDAAGVNNARDAVVELDELAPCAQTQRLLETTPRPTDPAVLEVVERLEARHAALSVALKLGRYEDVLEPARVLAQDTAPHSYAPMRAKTWALLGDAEAGAGTDAGALQAYEEALHAAIESSDPTASAEAAVQLGLTAGNSAADGPRGLRLLELARAFAKTSPDRDRLEVLAAMHEGAIKVTQGEMTKALALHEQVRDYWMRRADGQAELAAALLDIGSIYASTGRAAEALDMQRRAVTLNEAAYGADHPLTANALRELGNTLSTLERFDEAEVKLSRALEIQVGARGRESREVAYLLDDLGRLLRAGGNLGGAVTKHREAYEILRNVHDGDNPALVVSGMNIGYTLNAAGRWQEGLDAFVQALEMAERVSGPQHPHIVYAANAAASALVDQKRYDEAYVYAKKALDLVGKAQVPPTLFAETRFIATHALWRDGNVSGATKDRARALARRAREIYAEGAEQWGPYIQKIDVWLDKNGT